MFLASSRKIPYFPDMNCAYYAAQGFSMEPSVLDGDGLIVNTSPGQSYNVGEIVLYRSPHRPQPVAHRLVKIDHKHALVVIRSDADPRVEETLGLSAIIGKVEHIRRGDLIFRVGGSRTTTWMNHAIATVHPLGLALKETMATWVLPLFIKMQGTQLYRNIVHGSVTANIHVIPLDGTAIMNRLVATVSRQYAGNVDVVWQLGDHNRYGVISSLLVRARYRRAGLATQLLQHIESEAVALGTRELRVEHERTNQIAATLYKRLGYGIVRQNESGLHPTMTQQRKFL